MDKSGPDIVIIRRRAPIQQDQPKGGIWKIAHADFMTAMMALFLVLWLINATSQETRVSVAQYFNPVKLSNTTLDRKGVRNPNDSEPGDAEAEQANQHRDPGSISRGPDRRPSAMLRDAEQQGTAPFEDPYTILADVAAAKPEPGADNASKLTLGTTGRPGMNGGEALRDPFDPTYWRRTPPPVINPERDRMAAAEPTTTAGLEPLAEPQLAAASPISAGAAATPATDARITPRTPATAPAQASPGRPAPREANAASPVSSPREASVASDRETELTRQIAEALARPDGRNSPAIDVKATEEGLMISLTDNVNFGMFAIGSADPAPETVVTLERVAGLLRTRPGAIVIRGHTDARPFRNGAGDNWRLSTARAHTAQDILIRAGIAESRIAHVEGHASRRLRASDPQAAENRRIEILIQEKRT